MYHIIDNIYLSNLINAHDMDLIKKNKIEFVARLSETENMSNYPGNIIFYNFVIEDNPSRSEELIKICQILYHTINTIYPKHILIHCNMCRSRSVSIIAFYLMNKYKFSLNDSLNYIKKIKYDINPNNGFKNILLLYEHK